MRAWMVLASCLLVGGAAEASTKILTIRGRTVSVKIVSGLIRVDGPRAGSPRPARPRAAPHLGRLGARDR